MGLKNLGKTLINLPQSLEELEGMLADYQHQKEKKLNLKMEKEERYLEKYLIENFQPLDQLEGHDSVSKSLDLPGITLKQYQQQFTSKYLNSHSQQLSARIPSLPFNFSDKKRSIDFMNLEKQPPMVDTKPKKLVQIDPKIFKKLGAEAFLGVSSASKTIDAGQNKYKSPDPSQNQIQNQS